MKSKNIPVDISQKSIKEAQKEINDIISNLENADMTLESSIEQYNRMLKLNEHIQNQFKKKTGEIKNLKIKKI
tara:strand:- start:416 stop:634 length:219 start_codon:yes stop_codon:yes gene_type:complete